MTELVIVSETSLENPNENFTELYAVFGQGGQISSFYNFIDTR